MEENKLEVIKSGNEQLINQLTDIIITNQNEYETAVEFTKKVKESSKMVKDYWKPLKEQAAKTHKDLVAKEKAMLTPLEEAEKILKGKITQYVEEEERKAKEEEEKIKKKQEELALKQLEEADKLRENGDELGAKLVEQNAIAIDSLNTNINSSVQKVSGVSFKEDFDVEIIDEKIVPSYIAGVEIRTINMQAIKKLAKSTKGQIQIEGVKITKKKVSSIRV